MNVIARDRRIIANFLLELSNTCASPRTLEEVAAYANGYGCEVQYNPETKSIEKTSDV